MVKQFSGTFSTNLCQYVFQTISREKMLIIFIKLYKASANSYLSKYTVSCVQRRASVPFIIYMFEALIRYTKLNRV